MVEQLDIAVNTWLRFNWQITPKVLGKMGIAEEASIGYQHHLGFRCGTGFPYAMYDFRSEKAFNWLERPLILMESAAIHEAKKTGTPIDSLLQQFLDENLINTHISINFHNSNFDPELTSGRQLKLFYQNLILNLGN